MPRLPAMERLPALKRKPLTMPRKVIPTPPNDNKPRVVLDTGIILSALIASKRKFINSAPYQIIEAFKIDMFHLMINADLLKEYERVLDHKAKEGIIDSLYIGPLIKIIRDKGYFDRMFVDKPVQTNSGADNLLFDSSGMLGANYLVTKDMGDLKKIKIGNLKVIGPGNFLHKVLKIKT